MHMHSLLQTQAHSAEAHTSGAPACCGADCQTAAPKSLSEGFEAGLNGNCSPASAAAAAAAHLPLLLLLWLLLCAACLRFKELRDYVLARRDALGGGSSGKGKEPSIMDLDLDDATALKKSGKGFA